MGRTCPLAFIFASHLVVVAIAVLSGSPLTVACLFIIDAALTMFRILYERLAAGRPQTGSPPATDPYNLLEDLHDAVVDKRGRVPVLDSMPPVYPRNIPYVVESCILLYPLLIVAFPVWLFSPSGTLSVLAIPGIAIIAAKHFVFIQARVSAGVYETASSRRIRRNRSLLLVALLSGGAVAVLSTVSVPAATMVAATAVAAPWVLFDCRQAGLGPWFPVMEGDAVDRPISAPRGQPYTTFAHDKRAVRQHAFGGGFLYALYTGLSVMLPSGILAVSARAYWLALVMVVLLPVFLILPASALVVWIGESHIEYRLYDDGIVAYDTYLNTVQWVAPVEDVRSVSATDPTPLWRSSLGLPDKGLILQIERVTGETIEIRRLTDAKGFERAYRYL